MMINPKVTCDNLGGKGYQLSLLKDICSVPEFFVIAFDNFNEVNDSSIQNTILEYYNKMKFDLVSVRSSATLEDSVKTSFAGMFETKLNVNKDNLIEAIREVVSSAANDRVKEYCKLNNIDYNLLKMRVVIQKMVDSRISGVCFTRTGDHLNSMLIEACFGLGEALVSGTVTPDTFHINRDNFKIEKQVIGYQKNMLTLNEKKYREVPLHKRNARKLTNDEIKELVQISLKIEKKLNYKAVDIEWAFENDKLYILQARPISTINYRVSEIMNHIKLHTDWIKLYNNEYNFMMQSASIAAMEDNVMSKVLGFDIKLGNYIVLGGNEYTSLNNQRIVSTFFDHKLSGDINFFKLYAKKVKDIIDEINLFSNTISNKNFSFMSNEQLEKELIYLQELYIKGFCPYNLYPDNYIYQKLKTLNVSPIIIDRVSKLINTTGIYSIDETLNILKIAKEIKDNHYQLNNLDEKIISAIEDHKNKYGWMKAYDLEHDNMETYDTKYYLSRIKELLNEDVLVLINSIENKRLDSDKEFDELLNNNNFNELIKNILIAMRDFIYLQTLLSESYTRMMFMGKISIMKEIVYRIHTDIESYVSLDFDEQREVIYDAKNYDVYVKKNKYGKARIKIDGYRKIFKGKDIKLLKQKVNDYCLSFVKEKMQNANVISGTSVNGGIVKGKAKIIKTMKDLDKIHTGDILIADMTSPDYVTVFNKVAAFVTDEGGLTCHAAIVSKEFNVPCIVGTQFATQILKDNTFIEVDANNGIITILQ